MIEKKMNFEISVSTEKFKQKPTNQEWGFMRYQKKMVDIDYLSELIKNGYCFCQCFKTDNDVFGLKQKTISNFDYTNTIWLDIDDTFITIDEFNDMVHFKPSLLYSTPSNKTGINNRFRAIYVFENRIESNKLYNEIVDNIVLSIKEDIKDFTLKDTTCRNASQQFGGNASNSIIFYKNYSVFSFNDFNIEIDNRLDEVQKLQKRSHIGKEEKQYSDANAKLTIKDREFINDYFGVKCYEDACKFIEKYNKKYLYYDSTPLPEIDEDEPLIELPENYVEIKRDWLRLKESKRNGDEITVDRVVKLKAGNRGNILYKNAKLRMIMTKGITFEHLLFQLFCERQYYVDNGDRNMSNERLYSIAVSAFNSETRIKLKPNKRKFVINPAYKEKYKPNKNEVMKLIASAKRRRNDIILLNQYNVYLSVKENMKHFNELNIPISERKLYSFCQEQNIPTKGIRE